MQIQHAKIQSINKVEGERVYNFSIEEDESYIANNVIVHNCVWVSIMREETEQPSVTGLPGSPGGVGGPLLEHRHAQT